ncbi:MAG: hypothetical protein CVT59_06395 [Actinobacteria bacterium HGW-Actinobacteria-1]|nr:MAG: hypothetical protein CVT59_06395 [Actinobacteria bacterium HGW-Actinobacteria-1]
MDYFDIVKRALKVTWKYKVLWVLGFFVGGGVGGSTGGSSNYNSTFNSGSGSAPDAGTTQAFESFGRWADANNAMLFAILGLLILLLIVFWIFSVAAQGGLIHLVNEAEENREVRLRDGWRVGFSRWGRTFMVQFVVGLPIIAMVVAIIAIFGASLVGFGSSDAGAAGGFAGLCCGLPMLSIALIVFSYLLGIVANLALRYGVLQDVTFGQALARGWSDLTSKRGAFVFMLVMIIPSIIYGAISGVIALMFVVPAVLLIAAGSVITGAGIIVLFAFVMMIPGAAYGTFVSSAWTIFFRRMNGMERQPEVREAAPVRGDLLPPPPVPPAPQPPYAPAPPQTFVPGPPAPPAPPAAPEPPADV